MKVHMIKEILCDTMKISKLIDVNMDDHTNCPYNPQQIDSLVENDNLSHQNILIDNTLLSSNPKIPKTKEKNKSRG